MARSCARKMSRSCKRDPNRPPAEEGVQLGRHLHVGQELVAAQIQRADDHRQRFQGGSGFAIGLVLLLFARQMLAVQEQVLGAEQAHALRAVGLDLLGIGGLLDVGVEQDAMPVQRDGGLGQEVAQPLLQGRLPEDELAVFVQRLVGRIDDEDAVEAIEQRVLAALHLPADVLQPHHRRDAQSTGP